MSELIYNGNTKVTMVLSLLKVKKGDSRVDAIMEDVETFGKSVTSSLPLEPSSIIELNITEGAEMLGLVGSITIDNKFNILEALDFTGQGSSGHELMMWLQVEDSEIQTVDHGITHGFRTLVTITNQQEASLNFNENVVHLSFEESVVNAFKQISMDKLSGKTRQFEQAFNSLNREFNILELIDALGKTPTVSSVFSKQIRGNSITTDSSYSPNTKFTFQTATPATPSMKTTNRLGEKSPSVYEYLKKMLSETLIEGTNQVPYLRMSNTSNNTAVEELGDAETYTNERKFTFRPYITDEHKQMIDLMAKPSVERKKKTHDHSSVYTEKFSFGPLAAVVNSNDPNIRPHNHVEQFTTDKGHLQSLKDTVLADHTLIKGDPDPGRVVSQTIILEASYLDFLDRELPNLPASVGFNIPLFAPDLINNIKIDRVGGDTASSSRESEIQQHNHIYNRISRALLNVVESVTFTCNGLLLREPNKFIMIEQSGLNMKTTTNGDLDKLYYVNNVTHTFSNGEMTYTTRVQAGKWFGSTTREDIYSMAGVRMADEALRGNLPMSPTGQTTPGIRLTGRPDENFVEDFTERADRYIEEEKLRRKKLENRAIGLTEDGTVPLGADGPSLDAKASTNETIQEIVGDYEKGQRPVIEKDILLDYFDNLRKK